MEINSDVTLYASWSRNRRPATPTTEDESGSSTYAAVINPPIVGPTIGPTDPIGPGGTIGPDYPSLDIQNPLMYTIGSIPYYYMHAEIDRDPS